MRSAAKTSLVYMFGMLSGMVVAWKDPVWGMDAFLGLSGFAVASCLVGVLAAEIDERSKK